VTLDERKKRVLSAIVRDYIDNAQPVGSRTLARKYSLGVSPATIRNEMADLEDYGYLEQPHTSAGRIPSDKGYRFYVEEALELPNLSDGEVSQLQAELGRAKDIGSLMNKTLQVMAQLTQQAALAVAPQMLDAVFRYIQLLPLDGRKALAVLVTDQGLVEHRTIDLPGELGKDELNFISAVLSDHLEGLTLERIGRGTLSSVDRDLASYRGATDGILDFVLRSLAPSDGEQVLVGGTTNFLKQPEFRDVAKLEALLTALEDQRIIYKLVNQASQDQDLVITIGDELGHEEMHDCSLVTATYSIGGEVVGRIGIMGPRRMHYAKVLTVIRYVTQYLSESLASGS